jgi:ankyrin repeat protein
VKLKGEQHVVMLGFSLSGFLGDVLAPRPDPKHELSLLLRANQHEKAVALLQRRSSNQNSAHKNETATFSNLWIDDLDTKGFAPIHLASGVGALEVLLELLSQGANVNAVSTAGCTAIHYAAVNKHKGIVELLLRSGADPSIPNSNGQLAAELCDDVDIHTLLLRDRSLLSASKVLKSYRDDAYLDTTSPSSAGRRAPKKLADTPGELDSATMTPSKDFRDDAAPSDTSKPSRSGIDELPAPTRAPASGTLPSHQISVRQPINSFGTASSEWPAIVETVAEVPVAALFNRRDGYDGANASESDESEHDEQVYTAVGINSVKKPRGGLSLVPRLPLSNGLSDGGYDHAYSSGSEDAGRHPSTFSPQPSQPWPASSEARLQSPESDDNVEALPAPVLSLSELRKSISVSNPKPSMAHSPVQTERKEISSQIYGGLLCHSEVGVFSPLMAPKGVDSLGAHSRQTPLMVPPLTSQFLPQSSPSARRVSANTSSLMKIGLPPTSPVSALPPPPTGSPSTSRSFGGGPLRQSIPSSSQTPPASGSSSTSPGPPTTVKEEMDTLIVEAARETSRIARLEAMAVTQEFEFPVNKLQSRAPNSSLAGSEVFLRRFLLLACLAKSFDEEFVSEVLSNVPGFAKDRVVDDQLRAVESFYNRRNQQGKGVAQVDSERRYYLEPELVYDTVPVLPESIQSFTYLHLAAGCGNAAMAAILLDAGASPWAVDYSGRTPLHIALAWGNSSIRRRKIPLEMAGVGIVTTNNVATTTAADETNVTEEGEDDTENRSPSASKLTSVEDICSLLHMAMKFERGYEPTGENAPVDLLGYTPLGLFPLYHQKLHLEGGHLNPVSAPSVETPAILSSIPQCNFSTRAAESPAGTSLVTPRPGKTSAPATVEYLPAIHSVRKCSDTLADTAAESSQMLALPLTPFVSNSVKGGTPKDGLHTILSREPTIKNCCPSPSLVSLLLAPGDRSVLASTHPATTTVRSGRSPWRAPGTGDRDNIVYAFSSAKLWSSKDTEFPFAQCPLPGRPAWSFFALVSSGTGSAPSSATAINSLTMTNTCAALVMEQLPKTLVHEADKLARYYQSSATKGGLVNDVDTTPEILSEYLYRCCQLTDKAISSHPSLKVYAVTKSGTGSTPPGASVSGENPYTFVLENSVADCISALVTADYIATCSVVGATGPYEPQPLTIILAQRHNLDANRVSFNAGSFDALSSDAGGACPQFIDVSYMNENGRRRRRSKCSLAASLLTHPTRTREQETDATVDASSMTPKTVLRGYSFGSYLEKSRQQDGLRHRSSSDDSVRSCYSDQDQGQSRDVNASLPSLRADINVYHRTNRDAFLIIASRCVHEIFSAQEIVDFVAEKLGYTAAFGGPVGGIGVSTLAEACDSLVQICHQRGCIESIAITLILLGAPADPTRRSSPTPFCEGPVAGGVGYGGGRLSPRENTSDRLTPTISSGTIQALAQNTGTGSSTAAHSRRNSRRNTPATTTLAQQLAQAMVLSGSAGDRIAPTASLTGGGSIEAPAVRSVSRRNTPSTATIQAYIEAAQLGDYETTSISADPVVELGLDPGHGFAETTNQLGGNDKPLASGKGLSSILEHSPYHIYNEGDSPLNQPHHPHGRHDGNNITSREHSARDSSDVDGDHEHFEGHYTMVRDNLSESGVSVSSETYNYSRGNNTGSRSHGDGSGHAGPNLYPIYQTSNLQLSSSRVGSTSPQRQHVGDFDSLNMPASSALTGSVSSTAGRYQMVAVPASPSSPTIGTSLGPGSNSIPGSGSLSVPVVVTTPMSSLRSIFAMVADAEGTAEDGTDIMAVGSNSPIDVHSVRRQLLFQDN